MGKTKEVRIQKAVYRGFGLGYLYGKPVFLLHCYPNEKVEAKLSRKGRKIYRGEVLKIIDSPCEHRINPPCSYSGTCGGCHYQEIDYNYQLQVKRAILEENLHYIGKLIEIPPVTIYPSPQTFRYRPQCGFQVKDYEGRLTLGYFKFESQDFIPISDCHLLHPHIIELKNNVESFLDNFPHLVKGLLYIDFRMKSDGSKLVLTFGFGEQFPDDQTQTTILNEALNSIAPLSAILFRGWNNESCIGDSDIMETVNGINFSIGAGSFFQNNVFQWEPIQKLMSSAAGLGENDRLLDLFCGIGFWSLGIGRNCRKVLGIESNDRSVHYARTNAECNSVTNAEFITKDLSQGLGDVSFDPSVIIINPPRSGCSRRLMNEVAQLQAKKIIYVSCDPPSLARDIARLKRKGNLEIISINMIDMFPQTFSIETMVVMTPA